MTGAPDLARVSSRRRFSHTRVYFAGITKIRDYLQSILCVYGDEFENASTVRPSVLFLGTFLSL